MTEPQKRRTLLPSGDRGIQYLKRIIKKIPAVTSVDECTKALTGVGAAIAAGSQDLKGYCALLVSPATIKIKTSTKKIEEPPQKEINLN